tara:strand:+ start:31185 stop:31541 length:357 start_codon:yes stop_codon:yes gene_type:complete
MKELYYLSCVVLALLAFSGHAMDNLSEEDRSASNVNVHAAAAGPGAAGGVDKESSMSRLRFSEGGRGVDVKILAVKAEAGDAKAQLDLGMKYAKGDGVLQDYAQAVNWFTKSAKQGNS